MGLLRVHMTGSPVRFHADIEGGVVEALGILGVDISAREVNGTHRTVVQLLLADSHEQPGESLLDAPLVAELVSMQASEAESGGGTGNQVEADESSDDSDPNAIVARELFDHDQFRRRLQSERQVGESVTAGVLVLTDGELPAPWIRLAFLPVPLKMTPGLDLVIRRTSVDELMSAVNDAYAAAALTDNERQSMLASIEQYHPQSG